MKKHVGWSYRPYIPLMEDRGIEICRLVPFSTGFTAFWLPFGDGETSYSVFCKARDEETFRPVGQTTALSFTVNGLDTHRDYAFYIACNAGKSRVRLVRTGDAVGSAIIHYLHPEDDTYSFSGRYLCSPTLLRMPDGSLLASMDFFAGKCPQNLVRLFSSPDNGKNWNYLCDLFPCFWAKPFLHKGVLYVLGCSTEYGDLLIGASRDGGKTFTEPTVLLRGSNGKSGNTGIHKNPQPVVEYHGRIYETLEWGSWGKGFHAPMVMSADAESDLLDPASWSFSEPLRYNENWEGLPKGNSNGNIEGTLTVAPDGKLYNIMRYDMTHLTPNYGLVIRYLVDAEHPEAPLQFDRAIPFPANHSKFEIKRDEKSGYYYTICDRITSSESSAHRTLLSLMRSRDTLSWELVTDLLDYRKEDPTGKQIGFQYVDFLIEGDDILFVCRTAFNNANSYHNSNYITFHRINGFRDLSPNA